MGEAKLSMVSCKVYTPVAFSVDQEKTVGRFLRARKDVPPNQLIYQEPALVVAPQSNPVCICCLANLPLEGNFLRIF